MYGPKILSKLMQKKYRSEYGVFVVDGKKGVNAALASGAEVAQLVVSETFLSQENSYFAAPLFQKFFSEQRVLVLSDEIFERSIESVTPQGVAAVVNLPQNHLASLLETTTLVLLEDIRDPGNLGTMIRTADWFGVDGVVLNGGADPYQPKVVRSSMGSIFHVPLVASHDITGDIALLKKNGFEIVVTRPESNTGTVYQPGPRKLCFVFGNESLGTSPTVDALADSTLTLPSFGRAESLNVGVSFGIVLSELRSQSSI